MSNRFQDRINSRNALVVEHKRNFTSNVDVSDLSDDEVQRISNAYDVLDKKEIARIQFQRGIFRNTDVRVLKKLCSGIDECMILDIGCNTGELILDRVRDIPNVDYILGVDVSLELTRRNLLRDNTGCMDFACIDCESDTFVSQIYELYDDDSFRFDIVVLSMVLLHTKNPFKVLSSLRKLLKPGGKVFIRDMDDGFTVSYPDEKNLVRRMLSISNKVPYTGFRHCGRQLYSLLLRTGFKNIVLENEHITTIGLTYDELEYLFITNFQYIRGDLEIAYNENPDKYRADYIWMQTAYEDLNQLFHTEGYFYNMGTIVLSGILQ